jgi:hypothetical protein
MAIHFSISDSGKYLICRVDEPITIDIARRMGDGMTELAQQTGIQCRLLDVRGMPNQMSVVVNYDLAYKEMDELQINRSMKLACLVLPTDNQHDFVSTAIKNAGFNYRVFTDETEAVAWLEHDE